MNGKDKAVLAQKIDQMNQQLREAKDREKNLKVSYFELLEKYHTEGPSEKDKTSLVLFGILKKHLLLESDRSYFPHSVLNMLEKDKVMVHL